MSAGFSNLTSIVVTNASDDFHRALPDLKPAHILAALAKSTGVVSLAFRELGLDYMAVHRDIMALISRDEPTMSDINRFSDITNYAREEGLSSGSEIFDTIHLFLGVLKCKDSLVSEVLAPKGITYESAREKLKGFYSK